MKLYFSAGPSKVHEAIPEYLADAYTEGIMSINHRSKEFMSLYRYTQTLLRKKLMIPDDYQIFFTSSATECWEIIAQSLTQKQSVHFYNGSFGQKWFNYAAKIRSKAIGIEFELDALPDPDSKIPDTAEVLCLTQNETSNGGQIPNTLIFQFRQKHPNCLIAVDATSSMGANYLAFAHADIWFCSVQKGFGLPAGMGILICSARAMEVARKIGDSKHYNSLLFIAENAAKFQTHYTPNVLSIYLLMRVLKDSKNISKIDEITKAKADLLYNTLFKKCKIVPLISNSAALSESVLTFKLADEELKKLKSKALDKGFVIGSGYGPWKESTFRIANFPQHSKKDIKKLLSFFVKHFS